MSDTTATPETAFNIQRIYLKDLSAELPNAPAIFLEQGNPNVDVQLNMEATPLAETIFEVAVTATVTTKINDKVAFLVEAKQAGIFEIVGVPNENLEGILSVVCPNIVFPYLRSNVADAISRTGFPPVHLNEINFEAIYLQRLQEQQAASGQTESGLIVPPSMTH
ncbi:protein-export chaperone SecB [Parvibium lacunae]|uniref:Protein-export protein SecB n=1 Tax=Parvibium lacunae TaxID=1888893 RepID=A0A368L0X8_9BURK|nr:protein-export chaperone SecB [Parvibium lacunae]RCS57067.1 protein-export chaperone SecB [Parvibium lacunae]